MYAPSRMHAFCHYERRHRSDAEDDVTACVEFPNGATGTFITTADLPDTEGITRVAFANAMHLSGRKNRMVNMPFDSNRFLKLLRKNKKLEGQSECYSQKNIGKR